MDCIIVSFVKSIQPTGKLCPRAVIDDVHHRLPLSALTGRTVPCPSGGGWHSRYRGLSGTGSEWSTVDEVDQSQVVERQGQALGHGRPQRPTPRHLSLQASFLIRMQYINWHFTYILNYTADLWFLPTVRNSLVQMTWAAHLFTVGNTVLIQQFSRYKDTRLLWIQESCAI